MTGSKAAVAARSSSRLPHRVQARRPPLGVGPGIAAGVGTSVASAVTAA